MDDRPSAPSARKDGELGHFAVKLGEERDEGPVLHARVVEGEDAPSVGADEREAMERSRVALVVEPELVREVLIDEEVDERARACVGVWRADRESTAVRGPTRCGRARSSAPLR